MEKDYRLKCGICQHDFGMSYSPEERDGCTTNCPECEGLLILHADGTSDDFHKWLNKQSGGDWPADGDGTGRVEASPDLFGGGAVPYDFGDPLNENIGDMCCDKPDFDFPDNILIVKTPSLLCKNCEGEMFLRWDLLKRMNELVEEEGDF